MSLLQNIVSFAKETYNIKGPTNRSHPIVIWHGRLNRALRFWKKKNLQLKISRKQPTWCTCGRPLIWCRAVTNSPSAMRGITLCCCMFYRYFGRNIGLFWQECKALLTDIYTNSPAVMRGITLMCAVAGGIEGSFRGSIGGFGWKCRVFWRIHMHVHSLSVMCGISSIFLMELTRKHPSAMNIYGSLDRNVGLFWWIYIWTILGDACRYFDFVLLHVLQAFGLEWWALLMGMWVSFDGYIYMNHPRWCVPLPLLCAVACSTSVLVGVLGSFDEHVGLFWLEYIRNHPRWCVSLLWLCAFNAVLQAFWLECRALLIAMQRSLDGNIYIVTFDDTCRCFDYEPLHVQLTW